MPRIVNLNLEGLFALQRDSWVVAARQGLEAEKPQVSDVGAWLDLEFSETSVREYLEHRLRNLVMREQGTARASPLTPAEKAARRTSTEIPGDGLRADRLEWAFRALLSRNERTELDRLLGRILPRGELETNALRAVVVCGCIIDPDAREWLEEATPLAECVWWSDSKAVPRVKGRIEIVRVWRDDALRLFVEACEVLGWTPSRQRPPTPTTDSHTDVDGENRNAPALTANKVLVLATMARFDSSRLLSAAMIHEEMDAPTRVSERTIGPIVRKLIELDLAERPEGKRSGARLTYTARRLASKIAD
ncbi:MAG: hypothetical protein IH985_02730 [Planctomycetes bacterium]|nr:hypothetical protein [Planctomycetota bacterium]